MLSRKVANLLKRRAREDPLYEASDKPFGFQKGVDYHRKYIFVNGVKVCLVFSFDIIGKENFWHLSVSSEGKTVSDKILDKIFPLFFKVEADGNFDIEETPGNLPFVRHFWQKVSMEA